MLTRYTLLLVGFLSIAFGLQAQTYYMSNSVIVNCTGDFYDDGGPSSNYTSSMPGPITFTSDDAGKHMTVHFDSITLSSYDELRVYNGTTVTAGNLIYTIKGSEGKKKNIAFSSTEKGGSLTFDYYQGYYDTAEGWVASVSCCASASAGTLVASSATVCAGDTATMTVEGAYCGLVSWQSSADGTTWSDVAGKSGPIADFFPTTDAYYRAKFSSTTDTAYSSSQFVDVNCIYSGGASSVTECSLDFYDNGGPSGDVTYSGVETTTFYPSVVGEKVKIHFNTVEFNSFYHTLKIYDGNSTSASLLGTLSDTVVNRTYASSAADGSITVQYNGYFSGGAGWDADVSCCSVVDNSSVTLLSSASTVCGGIDFDLYLVGGYCGEVIWQDSIAGGTWSNISGAIGPYTTTSLTQDKYYRVAFDHSGNVAYSNTVFVDMNCFWMGNASQVTECGLDFYDHGGPDGTGSSGNTQTVTFYPNTSGEKVKIDFNSFLSNSYYGTLNIYNGNSTSATQLGTMSADTIYNRTYASSAADGSITVQYSGYVGSNCTWDADVSCCSAVDNTASLISTATTICAGIDFDLYLDGDYCGQALWQSSSDGGTTWADMSGKIGPYITTSLTRDMQYRAKFDFEGNLLYSNVISVDMNCFWMGNAAQVTSCNFDFYDQNGPNGTGTSGNTQTVTFYPDAVGEKTKIDFNSFRSNTYYGTINIYNGTSTSATQLGSMHTDTIANRTFTSSAADGSITVQYSGYIGVHSAWDADVSCCSAVDNSSVTLAASVSEICGGIDFDLTLTGTYCGQATYEYSENGGSAWAALSGKIGPHVTTSTTRDRSYRAKFDFEGNVLYSNVVAVDMNCFWMGNAATITDCNFEFFDHNGSDGIGTSGSTHTVTFYPSVSGEKVKIDFDSVFSSSYYQTLNLYNGNSTSATQLGSIDTDTVYNRTYTSSAADGSITVQYSGYIGTIPVWAAHVSCCSGVDNTSVTLASSVTEICGGIDYTLSLTGTYCGQVTYEYSEDGGSTWTALAGKIGPQITTSTTTDRSYRAKFDFVGNVLYSNVVSVDMNCFWMGNAASITDCNFDFYDVGGPNGTIGSGSGGSGSASVTFYPKVTGEKVKIHFNSVEIDTYYESINIYNGNSTSATILGSMLDTVINRTFSSSAVDGSLTVSYNEYSSGEIGWDADVTCCNTVDGSQTTVLSSVDTICAGEDFNLTITGTYCGLAQWQESTDNATWSDISGKIGPFITVNASQSKYYRVKFTLDATTDYSPNSVFVELTCALLTSGTTTVTACDIDFFDEGGISGPTGYNGGTMVFLPENPSDKVKITFNTIDIDGFYESISVYNGNTTSGGPYPVAISYQGSSTNQTFTSTSSDGALTVTFSPYDGSYAGWDADVTCNTTAAVADGTNAILSALVDTACVGDALTLTIGGSYTGNIQWQESTDNATTWNDLAGANGTTYSKTISETAMYRVELTEGATIDHTDSIEVVMNCVQLPDGTSDTTITTCGLVFYDNGGENGDYLAFQNKSLTVLPSQANTMARITFNAFDIAGGDTMQVFGTNSMDPLHLIDAKSGLLTSPETYTYTSYTASGGITMYFVSDNATQLEGWEADLSCCSTAASGTIVLSDTAICAGETFSMSMVGDYCGVVTWQYKYNDFDDFVDILNSNSLTMNYSITEDASFRAKVVLGTDTIYSNIQNMNMNCIELGVTDYGTACTAALYDHGGPDDGVYPPNAYERASIRSNTMGNPIVSFTSFDLHPSDTLYVYDGPQLSDPLLAKLTGNSIPAPIQGSNIFGEMTFVFISDGSGEADGFVGELTCCSSAQAATLSASSSTACAGEPVALTLAGSYCGSFAWQASTDNVNWTTIGVDENVGGFSMNDRPIQHTYYRAMYVTEADTAFSNTEYVQVICVEQGLYPIAIVCGATYTDDGGAASDYATFANDTTAVFPTTSGKRLLVEFGNFNVDNADTLYIYDGPNAGSPLLAKLNGTSTPANVTATNGQGALTFVFISQGTAKPGWEAGLQCVDATTTIKARIFAALLGPFSDGNDYMNDGLRTAGVLPTISPYTAEDGFVQVGVLDTFEVDNGVFDISTNYEAIVDWIWVELRSEADSTVVVEARPALLRGDGGIVDMDGTSSITFAADPAEYFIVLRHRNHLGVMTANPTLVTAMDTSVINFTDPDFPTYGTNARKILYDDVAFMWPGDASGNRRVTAVGGSSDVTPVTQAVLLDPANTDNSKLHFRTGYHRADLNMDGKVAMVGSSTEVTLITSNVILHPGNTNSSVLVPILEQLPE